MIIRKLFFSTVILNLISIFYAYEPPTPNIKEIINKSRVLFVGRIIETKEFETNEFQTIAIAKIKVIHCYKYPDDMQNTIVEMRYICNTIEDGVLHLDLLVGQEVLFFLNHDISGKNQICFDSKLEGGGRFCF